MTEDTINKWNGVVLRYDAFLKNRQALGIPAFDNDGTMVQEYSVSSPGWTAEDDAYLRSVHNIIIKMHRYLQDVKKGVRAIAWDSLNEDAAVLAVEGEPTIRTGKDPNAPVGYNDKDGDIVVTNFGDPGSKHVLPSDFVAGVGVGEPVTITGIIVGGIVIIGLTVGTVLVVNKICDLLDDHLTRAEAADIRRQQNTVIDTCDSKCPPNDLQCYDDCLNKAKDLTKATSAAIKTNEEARAAANKASDTQALYDTIKTVSLVALGLGVGGGVGYGIYRFAGPRPRQISEGRYPALDRGRPIIDAEVVSSRSVGESAPNFSLSNLKRYTVKKGDNGVGWKVYDKNKKRDVNWFHYKYDAIGAAKEYNLNGYKPGYKIRKAK